MSQIIVAIFEGGVLKPDGILDLAPGAKVQLVVTPFHEAKPADAASVSASGPDKPSACQVEPRMTREELHYRPTIYNERERLREQFRQHIQREWDATFEQRQKAFEEMERLRIEHPIDTRGERMTRDQLHERR